MHRFRALLRVSLYVAMTLVFPSFVHAQATRTWVSGVGDDVNPCSRTAPCKTFAGAISKTAKGGEINAIDPGGFGALTITKSITIDGSGPMAGILAAGTTGIIINITDAADIEKSVRIRGLSINGANTGIKGINVIAANKVLIENTVIDGFTTDGIVVTAPAAQVFVMNTTIRNNSGSAIKLAAAGIQAAISGVTLVFNGASLDTAAGATVVSFRNNFLYGNKKDVEPTTSVAPR